MFFADYGHFGLVGVEDVRIIKPEYLVEPFQAIECFLVGVSTNQRNQKVAK